MSNVALSLLIFSLQAILLHGRGEVPPTKPDAGDEEVAVIGWADDSHYILRVSDNKGNMETRVVDVRSGRYRVSPPRVTNSEKLMASIPSSLLSGAEVITGPNARGIVVNKDNDLFLFTAGKSEMTRLTSDSAAEVNTRYSPDGSKLAYTKNKDLYVFDLLTRKEMRLTGDASDKVYNGYAAWVYYEEIIGRPSHYAAFWWSPDGNRIAFLRFDESDVPLFTLNRLDDPVGIHGRQEQVPYPKAGDPNPKVRMGINDLATGKITWVKTDSATDQYIAWPFWTPDSKKLAVQLLNRDQNNLKIILADAMTGSFTTIHEESYPSWIEFHDDVHVLKNNSGFILRSYVPGWENLYYIGWDGRQKARLTDFDFRVISIDTVNEETSVVYFYATGTESTDKHAFRVGLDGKNLFQLTKGEGTHEVSISPGGSFFIDTRSSLTDPGSITAHDARGRLLRVIHDAGQPSLDMYGQTRSELVKILTSDGLFRIPVLVTYPLNFNPSGKYPVVFTIYGGPDYKNVSNVWQTSEQNWYAVNGIITVKVDHRGSGHFGRRGLDYLYRSLGKWEILDYSDAVKWILEKPYVDSSRIGITGSSYGGYLTCLALTKGSGLWTHGFAGSPVTDFRLYDNIYTERYMDEPEDNPAGYLEASVITHAGRLRGKLYIIHGDMDDNVHLQNSVCLLSKLINEGKSFRFMLYPGERHGFTGAKALHARAEAREFWTWSFFQGKE